MKNPETLQRNDHRESRVDSDLHQKAFHRTAVRSELQLDDEFVASRWVRKA